MGFLDDIPALNDGRRQKRQADQRRQCDQRQQRKPPAEPLNLDGEKVVYWRVIKCPYCNSRNCPVYCTEAMADGENVRIRRHKCSDCDKTFKSVEETGN